MNTFANYCSTISHSWWQFYEFQTTNEIGNCFVKNCTAFDMNNPDSLTRVVIATKGMGNRMGTSGHRRENTAILQFRDLWAVPWSEPYCEQQGPLSQPPVSYPIELIQKAVKIERRVSPACHFYRPWGIIKRTRARVRKCWPSSVLRFSNLICPFLVKLTRWWKNTFNGMINTRQLNLQITFKISKICFSSSFSFEVMIICFEFSVLINIRKITIIMFYVQLIVQIFEQL